jgi:hypothetical protein
MVPSSSVERGAEGGPGRRRRVRSEYPRQRQVVVRFSDAELSAVRERAALAGLAVGAWIGQTVLEVARRGEAPPAELPDLLRLHADAVLVQQAATGDVGADEEVRRLLARLDAVIDVVVAEFERGRR